MGHGASISLLPEPEIIDKAIAIFVGLSENDLKELVETINKKNVNKDNFEKIYGLLGFETKQEANLPKELKNFKTLSEIVKDKHNTVTSSQKELQDEPTNHSHLKSLRDNIGTIQEGYIQAIKNKLEEPGIKKQCRDVMEAGNL